MRSGWLAVVATLLAAVAIPAVGQSARDLYREGATLLEDGVARLDDETVSQSLGHFYRSLEINPRYADAAFALARGFAWLGEYEEAQAWIDSALQLRPNDTGGALIGARIAAASGQIDAARQLYAAVLEREPYNEQALVGSTLLDLSAGRFGTVRQRLETLLARYPENRTLLLTLALLATEREDYAAADTYVEIALRLYADMPAVHLLAAELAVSRRAYESAEGFARSAVALQPRLQRAWYLLVESAVATGDYTTALGRAEELVNLDPADADAWYARGALLERLGRTDDALRSLERAMSIRSDFSVARVALERLILEETELTDDRRAQYAEPYGVLAQQLSARFLDRQAESVLRHALRLDPFNAALRLELAELLYRRGYIARSLRELEIAREFGDASPSVAGRIEGLTATLADTPARVWRVDQFVQDRPSAAVATFVRMADENEALPFVADVILAYLRSTLGYREHVVAGTGGVFSSPSQAIHHARTSGDPYALLVSVSQTGAVVQLEWELVLSRNSRVVATGEVLRTGNGNLVAAVGAVVNDAARVVPVAGTVVARRFDEFLVALGRSDGIEAGQELVLVRGGAARIDAAGTGWEFAEDALIGTGIVAELDDFVAVCTFVAAGGIDRLSTETTALVVAPRENSDETTEETVTTATPDDVDGNAIYRRALELLD